jgi:hypothetical protein
MPRPRASVPPEAIRIEDEVWQEAFTRREPARERPRRLHAIDGGRPASRRVATEPVRPAAPRPVAAPRPTTATRTAPAPRTPAAGGPSEAPERDRGDSQTGGIPGRRTVTIRGYGAERNLPWPESSRRRPQRLPHERVGFRPDRVALWAVMLGILLVLVAIASPHG